MTKLEQFMQARPHDKSKDISQATTEYIEQLEKASVERYHELNK